MATESRATSPAAPIETRLVLAVALVLSAIAFVYCYQHNLLLLYGDAVAHLHIARRIFDSLNPGLRQLGSVWLPLPHLLLLPFVQKMEWWRSGVAGAIPSMACYVLGCIGIYRLARLWMGWHGASIAVAIYGLNPGLLYLQSTAMSEPLFLAEMIWASLWIAEACLALAAGAAASRRASHYLILAGCVLVASIYTRYDGWILATLAWLIVASMFLRHRRWRDPAGGAFVLFTAMLLVAPAIWLAYNARQFGDALDFMRGPYSARAIEQRTTPAGSPHHPGYHSMYVASLHFLKAAEMGVVPFKYGNWLLRCTALGTVAAIHSFRRKSIAAALLLWMPLPFYAYSIAYGSVPIFIPVWWPRSWYNTRYGLEMLPAFALFLAFLISWISVRIPVNRQRISITLFALIVPLILFDTVVVALATPLVLQEALANSRSRLPFERALADVLRSLPPSDSFLMYTSAHVGALQQAAIPLRRTVNEGDYLQYQAAIKHPAQAAPWVVAIDGDAVSQAVAAHPEDLELINVICSTGQPCARLYRSQLGTLPAPRASSLHSPVKQ